MLALTLRVKQKHVAHPPNNNTPSMCHDPLSQKFSFTKENKGYAKEKNIHAKKHERKKSMLKSMRKRKKTKR